MAAPSLPSATESPPQRKPGIGGACGRCLALEPQGLAGLQPALWAGPACPSPFYQVVGITTASPGTR